MRGRGLLTGGGIFVFVCVVNSVSGVGGVGGCEVGVARYV